MSQSPHLLIIGAGKMGGAMLAGAMAAGWPGAAITVIEPHAGQALRDEAAKHGFSLNPDDAAARPADMALLAIKPQMLDSAAPAIARRIGRDTVLVSIMAGKRIRDIAARLPGTTKIVRAMPNTPAAIGRGITGVFATPGLTPVERERVHQLLATTGGVEWVDHEALIDSVTAVSGSGPAYVFHLVECLAKAGEAQGRPADLAMRLARATIEGAGELLHREAATTPATLRQNVTSPGGTTAAALEILMASDGLAPLMTRAVAAARTRAEALSG